MKKPNVVQLNNDYIKDEKLKRRYEIEENAKRHRFMGWLLLLVMLLFILPTYNLISSYHNLQDKKARVIQLKKDYQSVSQEVKDKKELANSLKDNDFAAKYARAKYYYSKEGELIFPVPNLLPK
ncbi:septum formation initiator family protein [Streptococcus pluranimalium]|uniref:septum formation initiator family protein n=1 Tax=Streptococcus hyovaginalis TaxID=149015 RepID=UPI0014797E88|nr:septum formation initiator family protein [Streptococcus hyovaginalis]MDY3023884.1 septum formation initiator family protein [Streptococcus hyovaginalis]MDY4510627.1 septum formation initiator family protein [Streptococcus hyovaginalis]MDY5973974.1 septum formation initiator family protein [Streptococcus hyovaginalis]